MGAGGCLLRPAADQAGPRPGLLRARMQAQVSVGQFEKQEVAVSRRALAKVRVGFWPEVAA